MYKIFVQGIGFLALACSTLSFQQRKRSRLMLMQMAASLLCALQLLLLGAYAGACMDVISFIRNLVFSANGNFLKIKKSSWRIIFIIQMIIAGIFTWTGVYELLAMLAACLSTIALSMENGKSIRLVSLFVGPCWIAYNLAYGSYSGILMECIALASILVAIFRQDLPSMDMRKKKSKVLSEKIEQD